MILKFMRMSKLVEFMNADVSIAYFYKIYAFIQFVRVYHRSDPECLRLQEVRSGGEKKTCKVI